ncbi:uncharacterized protein [Cicer arietinum]|uniref:uncharacterized protein n=1 Tax=Cicer arietinum TaxID=3827 RepID=UPI003CC63F45
MEFMMSDTSFTSCWRSWMKACAFSSTLLMLVNGISNEEFQIRKGLKKGDHLTPFLFLLVFEGLFGMVKKAVNPGLFHGFQMQKYLDSYFRIYEDKTIELELKTDFYVWKSYFDKLDA